MSLNNYNITALIIRSAYFAFYYPSLINHLIINYNMDISSSSLFFEVPLTAYFIILQCLNYASEKIGHYCSISLGILQ
jgi:fucose permease